MDQALIEKLLYSFIEEEEKHALPGTLKRSLHVIENFFLKNSSNKLCLIFPAKELAAQWLSIPLTLLSIRQDYIEYSSDIYNAHFKYKFGDRLILNDDAIVEWAGYDAHSISFTTKPEKNSSGALVRVKLENISKLKPAPSKRMALSSFKRVVNAFNKSNSYPIDHLLEINTNNNFLFVKNRVCLVSQYNNFNNSIDQIYLNNYSFDEYFTRSKIDDNGNIENPSPLIISKNLRNLTLHTRENMQVSKIIIDGFNTIYERVTDFTDIDSNGIPTVLVVDLTEVSNFEQISLYGFDFFNLTKERIGVGQNAKKSPFYLFEKKLRNYLSQKIIIIDCNDESLDESVNRIHSIENDESNLELKTIKILLIQLANSISRIVHRPKYEEIANYLARLKAIEEKFEQQKLWLGESIRKIEESIFFLKNTLNNHLENTNDKNNKLHTLLKSGEYDYIICSSAEEAQSISKYLLDYQCHIKVIDISEINNQLLAKHPKRAIIVGWLKTAYINHILCSMIFSEIILLFYPFEKRYFNSLQNRNAKNCLFIKDTVSNKGKNLISKELAYCFSDIFDVSDNCKNEIKIVDPIDIAALELNIDSYQYSKYRVKGNLIESANAKRIDFENGYFIFSTESHKLLVINELVLNSKGQKANIYRKRVESIRRWDVIAFIITHRDILVDVVEKNTSDNQLAKVKYWIDLWKNLLKGHFESLDRDFNKLIIDLRTHNCHRHELTIRTWLQDESRIGPGSNSDLICIANMTNSSLLLNNIEEVRSAIRTMIGWRMKASDFIMNKIKNEIHKHADKSIINSKLEIEGLGSVIVLKVVELFSDWEDIDIRYTNRLLQKEIF